MSRRSYDLTGRNFHRWRVMRLSYRNKISVFWVCKCSCGNKRAVNQNNLLMGRSRSCGCLQKEATSRARKTHGQSQNPLYSIWQAMNARCQKPHHRDYRFYGARGIKVCRRWRNFTYFLADMEADWTSGLSIERNDVNKDYKKSNCRWATQAEQARNTRRNVIVKSPWGMLTASQCAEKIGINPSVFLYRLRRGWTGDKLFSPSRQFNRWNTKES
jgi:hypothetical protein